MTERLCGRVASPDARRQTVIHLAPAAQGGICRHIAALCAALEGVGWESAVAAPQPTLDRIASFGLPAAVERVPIPGGRGALSHIQSVRVLRGRASVFHAHGYRAAVEAVLSGLHPLVATAHNLPPERGTFVAIAALRRADAITAVSPGTAEALAARGIPPGKITVIPNGMHLSPLPSPEAARAARAAAEDCFRSGRSQVGQAGADHQVVLPSIPSAVDDQRRDETQFEQNARRRAPLIMGVGRLSPEKGFDVLIRAFERVYARCPGARLVLIGAGPERPALERLLKGRFVQSVTFMGEIADARLLLPAADVMVIPSRAEGQSLVALESLNAGLRTVASDVGGLPAMIRPGATGWLARPGDPGDLAGAILDALAAPSDRFAAAGRGLLAAEFDPDRLLTRLLHLYDDVIRPRAH